MIKKHLAHKQKKAYSGLKEMQSIKILSYS